MKLDVLGIWVARNRLRQVVGRLDLDKVQAIVELQTNYQTLEHVGRRSDVA